MRRVFSITLAAMAVAAATPALATPTPTPSPSTDPCSYAVVTGALACQGYYGNNLLTGSTGSNTTSTELADIATLLTNATSQNNPAYTNGQPYSLDYSKVLKDISSLSGTAGVPYTYDFSPLNLSGLTIFAAHFGNTPFSNDTDVTAFWLLDLGPSTTSSITISNGKGVSNAEIFATSVPGGVPEPATWAMMLLGFGGIGMAMRRRRKPVLMQVA